MIISLSLLLNLLGISALVGVAVMVNACAIHLLPPDCHLPLQS
jgi:hypothetical protein